MATKNKKTIARVGPAMAQVHAVWDKKQAEGWTLEQLGLQMGYPAKTARQRMWRFLKSKTAQIATIEKFAEAVGEDISQFTTGSASMAADGSKKVEQTQKLRSLPYNPIQAAMQNDEHARRSIVGILESYNGSYDALAEAVQNSMDAIEDAYLEDRPAPYLLDITVDLHKNTITVFDTGIGMTEDQVCEACAPSATFKDPKLAQLLIGKRGNKNGYRGYKGVGLTFLAYGTNDIQIQSRQNGAFVKGRMKSGRDWAVGISSLAPNLENDDEASPLDKQKRGTWLRLHFSNVTRPANLSMLGSTLETWESIIRTRTAAGQVLIGRPPLVPNLKLKLRLIPKDGSSQQTKELTPEFYYPHLVQKNPAFRFLNVWKYHKEHPGLADHAPEFKRQDGLYLEWLTADIAEQIGKDWAGEFSAEIQEYLPELYAFRPYNSPLWTEINKEATGQVRAHFFSSGMIVAVDRQRMAEAFSLKVSRSEFLAQTIFVIVHFHRAKPDQGRKTLQTRVMDLAQVSADAAVQYLAKQGTLLKDAGEKTTPAQREIELKHEDWVDNVKLNASLNPLSIPPVTYASCPLEEQDVVGLFNQFSALGLFPGIQIFATSQQHTYDCYVRFKKDDDIDLLRYSPTKNLLGLSTDVLPSGETTFATIGKTLEFKNSIEGLIADIESQKTPKMFSNIDICVCWEAIEDQQRYSYQLSKITEANLHEREFPGVTHVLRKDSQEHSIQVIMLSEIVQLIQAGNVAIAK